MLRWLILGALLCLSCNSEKTNLPKNPPIAIVGKDTIFLGDYKRFTKSARTEETDLQNQSVRVQLLNNLINSRLIEKFAIQEGFETNSYVQFKAKTYEDELFYSLYISEKLLRPMLSSEQIQETVKAMKTEVKLCHIVINFQSGSSQKIEFKPNLKHIYRDKLSAKLLADSLAVALREKPELFGKLAEQHSQDENTKYVGGDLGFLRYEDLRTDWANFVFNMKEKAIGVLEGEKGYHVVLCTGIRERGDVKAGDITAFAENILLGRLAAKSNALKLRESFEDSVLSANRFETRSTGIKLFLQKSETAAAPLTIDDKSQILASFSDQTIAIQDLIYAMTDNHSQIKFTETIVVKGLKSAAKVKLIASLARYQGLSLSQNMLQKLDNYKKSTTSEFAVKEKTKVPEAFTDAELSSYFELNKARYRNPDSVRIAEIFSKNVDTLNICYDQISKGRNFSEIFAVFQKSGSARKHPWMSSVGKSELLDRIKNLKSNEVSKPFQYKDGYAIVRLDESKSGQFQKLHVIRERVEQDMRLSRSQALYSEWMVALRSKYRVETFPEELAKAFEMRLR